MHSAPPVSYPLGRSRFAASALLVAWLTGAAASVSWWVQSQSPGWRLGLACFVLASTGAFAAWGWRHGVEGTLAWDGETWSWSCDGVAQAGEPKVCLDLQKRLLLRWASAGNSSRWFWLEHAGRPERWDDLRRAVYSRAALEALPGPRPPAAT